MSGFRAARARVCSSEKLVDLKGQSPLIRKLDSDQSSGRKTGFSTDDVALDMLDQDSSIRGFLLPLRTIDLEMYVVVNNKHP